MVRDGVDPSTSGFQTESFGALTWGLIRGVRGESAGRRPSKGLDDSPGDFDASLLAQPLWWPSAAGCRPARAALVFQLMRVRTGQEATESRPARIRRPGGTFAKWTARVNEGSETKVEVRPGWSEIPPPTSP